jgi:hypothetical protein
MRFFPPLPREEVAAKRNVGEKYRRPCEVLQSAVKHIEAAKSAVGGPWALEVLQAFKSPLVARPK